MGVLTIASRRWRRRASRTVERLIRKQTLVSLHDERVLGPKVIAAVAVEFDIPG